MHIRQAASAQQGQRSGKHQGRQDRDTQTRLGRQLALQVFQLAPQRFTVRHDGQLCCTRRDQCRQIVKNRARLDAGRLKKCQQGRQLVMGARVPGGAQTQLLAAVKQTLRDILERLHVLAQQGQRLGAHALGGTELVGPLADALGQHQQLTCSRDLRGGRVLLQLEVGHRLADLQQLGRLPVNQAQGLARLHHDFLLCQDGCRVLFGLLGQGHDFVQHRLVRTAQGTE